MSWRLFSVSIALGAALVAGEARALSVTFGDSLRYWPGYANGTSDDGKDTIGYPDLTGGEAFFEGGLLTSVRIDYLGPFSLAASGPGSVVPGDLFLDAGADGDWDYVMQSLAGPPEKVSILDVSGLPAAYVLSGSDNTGHWQGYNVRNDHPVAWTGGGTPIEVGTLALPDLLAGGAHSLLFGLGGGLDVGSEFVLAFGPSCANDVIFERVNAPAVPEPGAALLFGVGVVLLGRAPRRSARAA